MLRRFAGITALLLSALPMMVGAQSYAQRTNDIKAGILLIDSAQGAISKQPLNYTPHVWYNLDSYLSVKPAGWNIYNPRATTQVSDAVFTRWAGLNTDLGDPTVPVVGAALTKASAPYWEVHLSQVGEQQLSDYDVLLLSAYGYTNLNSVERDKLRKFVDQGGVLWIDVASSTNFSGVQVNTFPIPFQKGPAGGGLTYADVFSPLLSNPYALSLANLEQMRVDPTATAAPIDLAALGLGAYTRIESWVESDYAMHFMPVAGSGLNPTVLVGRLGDGYVVVTTSEYAMALNRIPTGSSYNINNRFDGLSPAFDRSSQLAAKFAVNILSLAGGYSQPGAGARKSRSNIIDLRPPLLREVSADISTNPALQAPLPNQSPVLYKGLLVESANDRIYVYDARPKTDLDADGNPDDGIQDASRGQDYDLLWVSQSLGGAISAPTCAEIPGSAVKDQIFVVGSNGILYAFDAFQLSGGFIQGNANAAPLYTINPPAPAGFNSSDPEPGPYAPTFHDGLLYIADSTTGTGRVWVADPVSQQTVKSGGVTDWTVGAGGLQTLPQPTASPTIGYIPVQDNSGAYDRVMYIPGRPGGFGGPTGTASITSLWMGVRGESPPPNSVIINPGDVSITTRAARQGLRVFNDSAVPISDQARRALGIKLTVLYPNGDPFTNADMATYFTGDVTESAGILDFPLRAALPPNVSFRIDYSIDWGSGIPQLTSQIIRGQLYLPDDPAYGGNSQQKRHIIGSIAMSPRGTIYCISTTKRNTNFEDDGGSFFAFREDVGRGGFRLLTRYDLYPEHSITLNQAEPTTYSETLTDSDPVTNFMPPFMQGRFKHLTFVGGPTVRNGVVFVTAIGQKDSGSVISRLVPYTILMAFKAEPEMPEIRVGAIPDGFSLRQPDMVRSSNHQQPTIFNDMSQGQFTYSRGDGTIRFDNMMVTNRGPVTNSLSTSQPVIIRRTNQPDLLVEPDALGNKWTPLLWYSVMHGVQPTGGPVVTGGSVFVPGSSVLPNIAQLIGGNIVLSGMVEAWSANVSTTDPFLFADANRPWDRQLYQITFTGSGPNANPDLLWPQFTGLRDGADYMVRVRQTRLGQSTTAYGLAGGDSTLAAWGDKGVYAFSHADFMVADEGRLARFDSNGNPLWSSDTSLNSGKADVTAVGTVQPLLRPVRAYPVSSNDFIVADPGSNRVARIDLTGREIRSITAFKIDPNAIPDGFQSNEPLTLNAPRDIAMFTTYELNGTQYWIHYLIADTGNKRILELADKYNVNGNRQITDVVVANGERQLGVLVWHSPSNYSGKDYDYTSIARVYDPNSNRYFYAAGIGSATPTRVNTGLDQPTGGAGGQQLEAAGGNGGIVIFDPTNPSGNVIVNRCFVPEVFQNTFWDFGANTFNSLDRPGHFKSMTNVNSVTSRIVMDANGISRVALMFTDATGVYEIWLQDATNDPRSDWQVRWMLPNEAYRALRRLNGVNGGVPLPENPMDLRATYARRLDDGDVLVVNGYLGKTRGGGIVPQRDFNGEVLQLDGGFSSDPNVPGFDFGKQNLGFDLSMIVFQLPPIKGARGLVLPVFADRR